ncbi:MAG: A24 family peptidase [Granulosicoccaceae bacterium]
MALLEVLQHNAIAFYGVVAFLSLLVGSFLNVVIYRLPIMMENEWREALQEMDAPDDGMTQTESADNTDQANTATAPATFNLSVPRSRCPNCDNLITWWQNVPVLSYLMLRGKCANCKTPISARYPIIEIVTMVLSLAIAWQFGPSLQSVIGIFVTWMLIAMTMIDFDHQLLPDSLTLPMMWIGLLASLVPVFTDVRSAVIGGALGYMILWGVYQIFKLITGKEGMGFGDFKLLAALGALLGWQLVPMIILLSSAVGAVVGISLIVIKGRDKNIPIPFGPYLAAAGWLAMMWGAPLAEQYYRLFA